MAAERYYQGIEKSTDATKPSIEWLSPGRVLSYDLWRKIFRGNRYIIAKAFERIRQVTLPQKSKITIDTSEVSTIPPELNPPKKTFSQSYEPPDSLAA